MKRTCDMRPEAADYVKSIVGKGATETRRVVMDVYNVPVDTPTNEVPEDFLLNGKIISAVPVLDENSVPSAVQTVDCCPVWDGDCEECDRVYGFKASGEVQSVCLDFESHLPDNLISNRFELEDHIRSEGDIDIIASADASRMRNLYVYNEMVHQFKNMLSTLLEHNVQSTQQMVAATRGMDRKLLYTLIDASKG